MPGRLGYTTNSKLYMILRWIKPKSLVWLELRYSWLIRESMLDGVYYDAYGVGIDSEADIYYWWYMPSSAGNTRTTEPEASVAVGERKWINTL